VSRSPLGVPPRHPGRWATRLMPDQSPPVRIRAAAGRAIAPWTSREGGTPAHQRASTSAAARRGSYAAQPQGRQAGWLRAENDLLVEVEGGGVSELVLTTARAPPASHPVQP